MTSQTTRPGWHRADIIAALHKQGRTLNGLSIESGYARSTLRSALHKPHAKANAIIARALGVPVQELWPHWYDAEGRRLLSGRQSAGRGPGPSSQIRAA